MNNQKRSLPKSLWWFAGSVGLMAIGAFAPWVSVTFDPLTSDQDREVFSMSGAGEYGGDGWLVVGAAGVGVIAALFYVRFRRRWLLAIPFLAGLAGAATAAYDLSSIGHLASTNALFDELFGSTSAEWGIYVALAGSISLALSSIGLLIERRRAARVPAELAVKA